VNWLIKNKMKQNYVFFEKRISKILSVILLGLSSFNAVSQVIYSNGAFSTGTNHVATDTAAPVGYTWSEMESPSATIGFPVFYNNAVTSDYSIADDFVVPTGQTWVLTNVNFYGYQTNYGGTTPPIDAVRVRIWNGDPSTGTATIVYGDMTTNVYNAAGSGEEFVYRVFNVSGTTRRVWRFNTTVSTSLTAGTYWIEFQVHAANDSSVFIPPVTIIGTPSDPSWNAKQRINTTWAALIDTGNSSNKALPFQILGNVTLGLNSNSLNSNFIMYPMPVNDVCNFKLKQDVSLKAKSISIYDIKGSLVQKNEVLNYQDFSIPTSNLNKGLYLLRIYDENGVVIYNNKLIKE
jgi:Secretion system C-terminal sorting domain